MIYIGKRSSKQHPDIDPYFGSGVHLKRAIKKYGKENFKKEIVAIADSAEEAEKLEEIVVDIDFIARKDTYNMIVGGQKGARGLAHTDESRTKMSEIHKGKTLSEETKSKLRMSEAQKGKKLSEETKARMSEAQKGNAKAKNRIWVNNGEMSKMVKPEEVDKYLQLGFTLGRSSIKHVVAYK